MKLQAVITGSKVHEVGYRVLLLEKALESGISRFDARNILNQETQQVVVRAEGEPDQLDAFRSAITGAHPPDAVVSDICFEEYSGYVIAITDFMHLIQVEQLTKGIPAIISIDKKQDRMLDKQDLMLRKMDHMESAITGEIHDLRTDLRSYLDRKLSTMEQDIQQIKAKIGLM